MEVDEELEYSSTVLHDVANLERSSTQRPSLLWKLRRQCNACIG